jgi:hypothetical protein
MESQPGSKAKLYQKIAKIMGKVERVPKNGYNSFHKYQYVTESDLIESVRKFMAEEGLVLFNSVRDFEVKGEIATVTLEFTLACTDTGESVTTVLVGQGQDKGDKAFYKAYAGGTKYFLMKTFLVPTGDDPEADVSTDQKAYGAPKPKYNNKPAEPTKQALAAKYQLVMGQREGFEGYYEKMVAKNKNHASINAALDEALAKKKQEQTA